MKVVIPFKRLNPMARKPVQAHKDDAGFDIVAVEEEFVGNNVFQYRTGLAFAVPKGYFLMCTPRSSIYQNGLVMANGIGVIDAGYRGEVTAMFYGVTPAIRPYHVLDRIMQVILMPAKYNEVVFMEVSELPPSDDGRGTGGLGSTGR